MSLGEEFLTFRRTVVASSSASDCWTLKKNALRSFEMSGTAGPTTSLESSKPFCDSQKQALTNNPKTVNMLWKLWLVDNTVY